MEVDMKRLGKEIGNSVKEYDVDDSTDFMEINEEVSLGQINRLYFRDFAIDAQRLMQGIKTLLDTGIFTSLIIADIDYFTDVELASAPLKTDNQLNCIYLSTPNVLGEKTECFAKLLKQNNTLVDLSVIYSLINTKAAEYIADTLKVNTKLTRLHLTSNQIGDQDTEYIAGALKINTTLMELYLVANKISDSGAKYIADSLKENTTLTKLYLTYNQIGDSGARHIAAALKENTTLTKLYLSFNLIGDLGAKHIAVALQENTTLTKLELNCNLGDLGVKYITDALKVNKSLSTLTFCDGTHSDRTGWHIVDCLKVNKALLHIDLYNMCIHEGIINQADILCANNKSRYSELVKFINHNANNIIPISYKAFDALAVTAGQEQDGFTKIMFCTLLTKVSISHLKTQCGSSLVDSFKHLVDANFFKIFGICKEFQNDHPFKNIPEEVMVQITHNLPLVVWEPVMTISAQDVVLELVGDIDAYQAIEPVE
jgi:hypothetical protein